MIATQRPSKLHKDAAAEYRTERRLVTVLDFYLFVVHFCDRRALRHRLSELRSMLDTGKSEDMA